MVDNVLTIYEDTKEVVVTENNGTVTLFINEAVDTEVVTIGIPGIQGPIGPAGPAGSPSDWMDDDGTVPSSGPSATGDGAIAIGFDSNATGSNAYSQGSQVYATGDYSHAKGYQSNTHGIHGAESFSSGMFDTIGDAQRSTYLLRGITTDANTLFLTTNNSSVTVNNVISLKNDESTLFFSAKVVGRHVAATDEVMAVEFRGVVDRNVGVNSLRFLGKQEKSILAKDNAAWQVNTEANTTNGALQIYVNGQTSKTVRWLAQVDTVEIGN